MYDLNTKLNEFYHEHPHMQEVVGVDETLGGATDMIADIHLLHQGGYLTIFRESEVGQWDLRPLFPVLITHIEAGHFMADEGEGLLDRDV